MKRKVITSFAEFETASRLLPGDLTEIPQIIISNPFEAALFDVADKHGVLDEMLSPEFNEYVED